MGKVWELLAFICSNVKKHPLGAIPRDVHPDGRMVLCPNMKNTHLVSSQRTCRLMGGWFCAHSPGRRFRAGGAGSG